MALIISLTTIKSRLDLAYIVIYSLLKQELKPDKIYLWISKERYLLDDGIEEEPNWYRDVDNNIVTIRWTNNIGPYRKLNPLYLEIDDDDIVITVDDDMYFGRQWLKKVIKYSAEYPDDIIAGLARIPSLNIIGKYKSYDVWPICRSAVSVFNIIPIGAGGILYKKRFIDPDVISSDDFLQECPVNDDIWYRYATAKKNTCVTVGSNLSNEIYKISTPDSLWDNFNSNKIDGWQARNFILRHVYNLIKRSSFYFNISKSRNNLVFKKLLLSLFQ